MTSQKVPRRLSLLGMTGSRCPTIAAVFATITDVLATVTTVLDAVAHVLAVITHILPPVTNVLPTIPQATIVQRVASILAPVAYVFRPVTPVFQTVPDVLTAIAYILAAVANVLESVTAQRPLMKLRVERADMTGLTILCAHDGRGPSKQGRGDRSHSEIAHRIPQRQKPALAVMACAAHSTLAVRSALSTTRRKRQSIGRLASLGNFFPLTRRDLGWPP